ncbi:MAG TPA: hypothetical protein VGO78_20505 [Acidimicrobiales bacterium]|nr:hypothetical protein [Acidimicrobiales bacterium]
MDVEPGTLLTAVQEAVAGQLSTPTETVAPAGIALRLASGKPLTASLTLADYNVQQQQTLLADVTGPSTTSSSTSPSISPSLSSSPMTPMTPMTSSTMSAYFPHLKEVLAHDLTVLATQPNVLVFIGIASYDNGHPQGHASIRRQQCPAQLFDVCVWAQLTPHILLLDQSFATIGGQPQIYDIDPGWSPLEPGPGGKEKKERTSEKEEKVERTVEEKIRATYPIRRFRHTNGAQLCLYPTYVDGPEYNLLNSTPSEVAKLGTARTLAGLDLHKIAAGVAERGGALVAGNFFSEAAPYCLAGPTRVLAQLGAPYYLC